MDIRNFLKRKCNAGDSNQPEVLKRRSTITDNDNTENVDPACSEDTLSCIDSSSKSEIVLELDIGKFVKNPYTDIALKRKLLLNTYTPPSLYDFKGDVVVGSYKFRHVWLATYAPWLAYSPHLKGAICKYCVLFPQPVHRGIQGSFIICSFTKYHKFNEEAARHKSTT